MKERTVCFFWKKGVITIDSELNFLPSWQQSNFGMADCLLQEARDFSQFIGEIFQQIRDSRLLLYRMDTRGFCPSQISLSKWLPAVCLLCSVVCYLPPSVCALELQHKSVLASSIWTVAATPTKIRKSSELSPEGGQCSLRIGGSKGMSANSREVLNIRIPGHSSLWFGSNV